LCFTLVQFVGLLAACITQYRALRGGIIRANYRMLNYRPYSATVNVVIR